MVILTSTQLTALQSTLNSSGTSAFYNLLESYGDSYGTLGKGVTNNSTWQGQLANGFAASAAARAGVNLSYGSAAWTSLNDELAQEYLDAYNSNSGTTPPWDTVQDLHNDQYDLAQVPRDGWFPNKLLNDSSNPAEDWDDWQDNSNAIDLLEDSLDLTSELLNLIPPVFTARYLADSNALFEDMDFMNDFLNGMNGMDNSLMQNLADVASVDLANLANMFMSGANDYMEGVQDWFDGMGGGSGGGSGGGGGWTLPCWIGCDTDGDGSYDTGILGGLPPIGDIISPLVLDLDASGTIDLLSIVDSEAFFDLDQDGMAERVGWVESTDGLLAIDLNSDGFINDVGELFGNATTDGFTILAQHDSNNDGRIDSTDNAWSDLLVWQDDNEDGYSQAHEIHTLDDLNITQFDLSGVVELSSPQINEGNQVTHTGTFTIDNGGGAVSRAVHDIWFNTDQAFTRHVEPTTIDVRTLFLPNLRGSGNLKDLHIAMSDDNTGTGNLLDQVVGLYETDFEEMFTASSDQAVTDILYRWADIESVAYDSRGRHLDDARHLEFIEELSGEEFYQRGFAHNPYPDAANGLEQQWDSALQNLKATLFIQSGGGALFTATDVVYDFLTGDIDATDFDLNQSAITDLKDHALTLTQGDRADYWENIALFLEVTKGDVTDTTELGWLDSAVSNSLIPSVSDWDDVVDLTIAPELTELTGSGTFSGTNGDEKLVASNGDDTANGQDGADTILGKDGNDTLNGDAGNDTLDGGSGNDTLDGGTGDDVAEGKSGNDTYIYTSGDDAYTEFGYSGSDVLKMGAGIVAGDLTFFRTAENDLYITVDGKGEIQIEDHFNYAIEALTFTEAGQSDIDLTDLDDVITYGSPDWDFIQGVTDGNGNDTIYGYAGNDSIVANAGDDLVYGGDDHDKIQGLDGADMLYGESGNDDIHGGNDNDFIYGGDGDDEIETWSGNDYVEGGDGDDDITNNSGDDEIYGGSGNDTITAKGGDDEIHGGTGADTISAGAGEDLVYGDDGNDIIDAGSDADVVYGGNGNDTIDMGNAHSSGAIDYGYGGAGDDTISGGSYEQRLYGEAGNDTLDGGNHDDYLYGGADNDTLIGGDGWDELYGDDGDDILEGNRRDDTLDGGLGSDTTTYHNENSSVTVNLSTGNVSGGGGSDTLISIENIRGSDHNDILTGDGGSNIINGDGGNDTIDGGAGIDTASYAHAASAVSVNLSLGSASDGDGGSDTLTGIENVDGSAYDDLFISHPTIDNDFDGGAGEDTVSFAAATNAIEANLNNGGVDEDQDGQLDEDTLTNIENLVGSDYNDTLNGNANANKLWGGGGADEIRAGDGADEIHGDAGNDNVYAQNGDDTVYGGSGDDTLRGEAGADTLYGGDDDDDLFGGDGADTLYGDDGWDVLESDDGDDVLYGGDGKDTLRGGNDNDTLYGEGGNDNLVGGNGDDTLYGGDGNDKLWGEAGADTFQMISPATTFNGNVDWIMDFSLTDNDVIEFQDVLDGFVEGTSDITDYVQMVDGGTFTSLRVDRDGSTSTHSDEFVIRVQGLSMTDFNNAGIYDAGDLKTDGHLTVT